MIILLYISWLKKTIDSSGIGEMVITGSSLLVGVGYGLGYSGYQMDLYDEDSANYNHLLLSSLLRA